MSENRRILAPHKEQNGWVYVRVRRSLLERLGIFYDDDAKGARVISSRRVEEAVETADYLKRCAEEGLEVRCGYRVLDGADLDSALGMLGWAVWSPHAKSVTPPLRSSTLREAYWRYKNESA